MPAKSVAEVEEAVDLLEQVGRANLAARALQVEVREGGRQQFRDVAALRRRVRAARPALTQLLRAMVLVAPDLRICRPELADCDCKPDPGLIKE